jgi:hypothetical protein
VLAPAADSSLDRRMTLHLLKLCVGVESLKDLEARIAERLKERRLRKEPREHWHTTRMVPKRAADLLDGGSLYWVIKGQIAARQILLDVEPFTDDQGISRCRLRLEPRVTAVRPRACRPFQGWRYLNAKEAPPDLAGASAVANHLPETLRRELLQLGLL